MNRIETNLTNAFVLALAAPGRASDIAETDDVYGWLVGSWSLDVLCYRGVDLRGQGMTGEVHFGWVLEGRAIEDVWIMPARGARPPEDPDMNMYGTTLRSWDPELRAWRIQWTNPARSHRETQIGRRIGRDIVQTGARSDGQPTRWRFTDIAHDRFHWIGEALDADGATWRLEGEFLATRTGQ
ncbi:hypothetical protein WKR88_28585 [Trinickia caryophylli]|uniref:Uncharacterized protein n=1 Tax=Trinickia caryophylli TaxID=28094 RepID=A0A1X7DXS5_TRICW|nr:hypothetical protein [Trinickia caryophylli]PMS14318.1 hypothetical protein C0Z17_01400 [Trinickia caryophylli]TRX17912.1 hypothetical protein FNF07_06525 [Trinickia caryophylli]WQE11317.1 hypothetical protein U0034_16400 [Trinickia caryophylli]SMF23180.1 hypothetical protein SAMN06295900_104160 [Trinickia caryophylli]GLU32469.1 hypothetical protein Busp01_23110 [Trinickia caryophylli]